MVPGVVCKDIEDNKNLVEHLEQHPPSQKDFWQHRKVEDVQTVVKGQSSHGELMWEILSPTATCVDSKYHLKN